MSTLNSLSKRLPMGLLLAFGLLLFASQVDARTMIARPNHNPIYLGPVAIQVRAGHRALPTFVHNGGVYVLGSRGLRYSIYIKNRTPRRLEVVAAVDGRDVISGRRTRGFTRRGYVLNPYKYVNITGFRTSKTSVAAFRFSSIRNAYAVRRGSSWWRVGSLHIAVFRERGSVVRIPRPLVQRNRGRWRDRSTKGRMGRPASPSRRNAVGGAKSKSSRGMARRRRYHRRWRPGLGTAYGERRYAPASYTTFVRASSRPSHQLTIGYNNCAGFRSKRICSRWCRCFPIRRWHHHRRRRRPLQQNPRFAPPPSN